MFIFIYPVPNTKTKYAIEALLDIIKNFGAPNRVINEVLQGIRMSDQVVFPRSS